MSSRWTSSGVARGDDYDARFTAQERAGEDVHGEASFVAGLEPATVLDAGCGTGRVAIELARRGVDVVGVDIDPAMLATARRKAPHLTWVESDLISLDLGRTFDVIVMAGNVMIFVDPGTEGAVVASCARQLEPGGALVCGFQLSPGRYTLDAYDRHAAAAGLELAERYATWDREPWTGEGDYAVSVHRRRT